MIFQFFIVCKMLISTPEFLLIRRRLPDCLLIDGRRVGIMLPGFFPNGVIVDVRSIALQGFAIAGFGS